MKIVRSALLLFHLIVLVLLLGIFANKIVPPQKIVWFNLLSLLFPYLMLLYLGITLLWGIGFKKRFFFFLFFILFFINPITRWLHFGKKIETPSTIKIVSLNVKGGSYGIEKIEQYINAQNADVVLLQEDKNKTYNFEGLTRSKENRTIAMYSRFPIRNHKILINGNTDENYAYCDQADLTVNGKTVRFFNLYLEPYKISTTLDHLKYDAQKNEQNIKNILKKMLPIFRNHQSQVEIVLKEIEQSPYPIILGGDFNAVPNSYEYYQFCKRLEDPFMTVGNGLSATFFEHKIPLRLDYILASKSIKPIQYAIDRNIKISDHYPIFATFFIP